jgi:hypothetical protein
MTPSDIGFLVTVFSMMLGGVIIIVWIAGAIWKAQVKYEEAFMSLHREIINRHHNNPASK